VNDDSDFHEDELQNFILEDMKNCRDYKKKFKR
jgi:hypothetical protein